MDFREALESLGFRASEERRVGGNAGALYVATPNPFMTYTVQAYADGTALFTWEFAIAQYVSALGMEVGSGEQLNLFLYPRQDIRGPQDGAWLAGAIDRTERLLASVRLEDPTGADIEEPG